MESSQISSSSQEQQQQIKKTIVKVNFRDQKFKQVLTNEIQTFKDFKKVMFEKIKNKEQEKIQTPGDLQCLDDSDYEYNDDDNILDHLNNNDVVKISSQQSSLPLKNDEDAQKAQKESQKEETSKPELVKQQPSKEEDKQQNEAKIEQEEQQQVEEKQTPTEAIVVLYDVSGSMGSRFYGDQHLSRMGATNAFFSAFADKTMAFEFDHLLSLSTFGSSVEKKCEFINDYQKFINLVDSANPGGCTRLYDCIQNAIYQLKEIKIQYPNIILRILALTDGEDNQSKSQPLDLAKQIIKNRIIVDSFVVSPNCQGLKTITHASGGKCYKPQDINEGLQLFEIETILSAKCRGLEESVQNEMIKNVDKLCLQDLNKLDFDSEGIEIKQPKSMQKAVETPESLIKKAQLISNQNKNNCSGQQQQQQSKSAASQKRIYKELANIVSNPNPLVKFFPTVDDINTWKVLLIGPKKTVFNQGVYQLLVQFPTDYPFKPPKVQFMTKIYHCNVSTQGRLCLDIILDQWSPALSIDKVFASILSLLENPNPNDALESNISAEMLDKDLKVEHYQNGLKQTKLHANLHVDTLISDIMGVGIDRASQGYLEKKEELEKWIKEQKETL